MSRKFRGKCFYYASREVPDLPMTNVVLGGLDGFDLSKSSTNMRSDEPNSIMRDRKASHPSHHRRGEDVSNRSTITHRQARIVDWSHSNRETDNQSV